MSATAILNRNEAQRLTRKAADLEREADDLRTAGLDDRADDLESGAETLREKVQAWKREKQRKERERRRRNREAQERHEKAQKEMEAERKRRREAREWYRNWTAFSGGRPQPASQVLDAAERAGHDPADLEAAVVRLRRLKDGVECLGFKGEYLRGEFRPVEELSDHVKR